MELCLKLGERRIDVQMVRNAGGWSVTLPGGQSLHVALEATGDATALLRIEGRTLRVRFVRCGRNLHLQAGTRVLHLHWLDEEEREEARLAAGSPVVSSPMPGKVVEVLVQEGQEVRAGDPVVVVEAMKMETELTAAVDGRVETVHVRAGDLVDGKTPLVTLVASGVVPDEGA